MATSAYRNLWRSANVAFRGDTRMLTAARTSIRTGFQTNRHLEPTSAEIAPALQHANEVALFLRQNVVQGKKLDGDEDRYSAFFPRPPRRRPSTGVPGFLEILCADSGGCSTG